MEKKIKKLQLKKETIAILNGDKMSHVIGGVINPDGSECPDGYAGVKDEAGDWYCVPLEIISKLTGKYETVCDVVQTTIYSVLKCPTLQPTFDTGAIECPTLPWCSK